MRILLLILIELWLVPQESFAGGGLADIRGDRLAVDVVGRIAVLDESGSTVSLYSPDGALLKLIGGQGWNNDQFDSPRGVWAGNSVDIFVADYGNHRVQRFDRSLNFVSSFSTRESSDPSQRFGYPLDVALSRLGDLFICDGENSRVIKVNRLTQVELSFGGFDAGKGRLTVPSRIALGPSDHIYVVDKTRIAVFDNFGNYLHDLPVGRLHHAVALDADENRIVAVNGNRILLFARDDFNGVAVPVDQPLNEVNPVRDIALKGNSLLLLTDNGIVIIDLPKLDK